MAIYAPVNLTFSAIDSVTGDTSPIIDQPVTIQTLTGGSVTAYGTINGTSPYTTLTTGSGGTINVFVAEGVYNISLASGSSGSVSWPAIIITYSAMNGNGTFALGGSGTPGAAALANIVPGSTASLDGTILLYSAAAESWVYSPSAIMAGDLKCSARPTAPTGWLLCNGQSVSSSTYPDLYAAILNTYGGNSSNFNVPDLRGRVPIGAGTGTAFEASTWTLGEQPTGERVIGGEEQHILQTSELAVHNHGTTDYGHVHGFGSFVLPGNSGGAWIFLDSQGSGSNIYKFPLSSAGTFENIGGTATATTGITINNSAGGSSFNIMQPVTVVNWFIKT